MGSPKPGVPDYLWCDPIAILQSQPPFSDGYSPQTLQLIALGTTMTCQSMVDFCAAAQPDCAYVTDENMIDGSYISIYYQCALAQFWWDNCDE